MKRNNSEKTVLDSLFGGNCDDKTPLSFEETMALKSIPNLQPGDLLRYNDNGNLKHLKKGDVVCVYRIDIPPTAPQNLNSSIIRDDFTFILKDTEGDLFEVSADSKFFERVKSKPASKKKTK